MKYFHPFAQVFDDYCCQYHSLKKQPDKTSQCKANIYRMLDSLIRLYEDTIYDMFDKIIAHKKDILLNQTRFDQTSLDVQQIIHRFVTMAGTQPQDYTEMNEKVYYDFKWAFAHYKKNGGRATRGQWTYGGPRNYN